MLASSPPENLDMFLQNVGLLTPNYMAFIPEDRILLNHRYKNLKSYVKLSSTLGRRMGGVKE
jgi:hypothetical protein